MLIAEDGRTYASLVHDILAFAHRYGVILVSRCSLTADMLQSGRAGTAAGSPISEACGILPLSQAAVYFSAEQVYNEKRAFRKRS